MTKIERNIPPQGQGDEFCPNTEAVKALLERVKRIEWFRPTKKYDPDAIQELVRKHRQALNDPGFDSYSFRLIHNDWRIAVNMAKEATSYTIAQDMDWFPAWNNARNAAKAATRSKAWNMARDAILAETKEAAKDSIVSVAEEAARKVAWDVAEETAEVMANCAQWIVVADLMGSRGYRHGNPYEPLVKLYEMGLWPIGLVRNEQTGKVEFAVFHPPVLKGV